MVGQTALSESLRGVEAAIAAGHPDQALALCQDVQTRFPRALPVQRVLGEVYLALRKPREALAALDRALAGNPEDARACCARALVHQIHGDSLAALAWYRRACDIAPDDQVLRSAYREMASHLGQPAYQPTRMGLARLYLRGDLYPHATREFEALLVEQPDALEAQVGLTETLWRSRRADEAAERCRRTLNNTPSCVKALLILAATEYDAGQTDETQRLLRRVAELDPDSKLARSLFADRIAAGDTAFARAVLGDDGASARDVRQTGALSGVLDPRLAGAVGTSTSRPLAQTQGQPAATQPYAAGQRATDGAAASPAGAGGAPRASGLPADFRTIFAETEYMLWSRDDDATQAPTGALPAFERSRVDPFARSSAFVPPVLREQGGAMDDTEARAAINWIHWLQAQGARARDGLAGAGRPATGPLTGQVPGAPGTPGAATPPVQPAPSPSGRLTPALPPQPIEQRPRPATGPLLPPVAPMPPASGPLHLGTGPLPPATGPLPPPSSEALRAMFAELEPEAANPRVVEGELVSAVDAVDEADVVEAVVAADAPAPTDAQVPMSASETDRLDEGATPALSWSESPAAAAGWTTDEHIPESLAHLSMPTPDSSLGAEAPGVEAAEDAEPRDEPGELGDSAPLVTLESLERSFSDSGFSSYELRPGELAALSDSAAPDNGWHLAGATERAPAVHFEQSEGADHAEHVEPAVSFEPAEPSIYPEQADAQPYQQYEPYQPPLAATVDPEAQMDTAALVEPAPQAEPEPRPAADDYHARLEFARRRRDDGRLDEALDEYRAVLKNSPDLLDAVVTELQQSLSEAPDHPEVHRLLGDARIRQGDYLSALEAYNRAVALTQAQGS